MSTVATVCDLAENTNICRDDLDRTMVIVFLDAMFVAY